MSVGVLDDVGAFAGAVADEQAWTLLQVFCEAGFVDDCRGGFGDLAVGRRSFAALRMTGVLRMTIVLRMTGVLRMTRREYCSVDFHAAGVDHWDDEAGIPDQVGDDVCLVGDDGAGLIGHLRLGYECVECADCDEGLLGTET